MTDENEKRVRVLDLKPGMRLANGSLVLANLHKPSFAITTIVTDTGERRWFYDALVSLAPIEEEESVE